MTGNVRRFVNKLGRPASLYEVRRGAIVTEPYVLVTPTTGFGQVPSTVAEFVRLNAEEIRGVAVSGNANWGVNYGKAGVRIAEEYGVPLLLRFELSGTDEDVRTFNKEVDALSNAHTSN